MKPEAVAQVTDWQTYLKTSKQLFQENYNKMPPITKSLDDFEIKRTVGTGSFGNVVVARCISDNKYYAIKIIERAVIVSTCQVEQTLSERNLLMAVKFPLIINMEYYFKDNTYIFFVMPFINGGEMFTYLRQKKYFTESESVFYAAQVVLALEFLHYLDIIYRDLKPENILIDSAGYIKMTDLGFAKIVTSRTYSLCGTPDYIAPEILLSKGYSHSVDWWALGILIYEMVVGQPPFYAPNPMKTYELIVKGNFALLPSFSANLKDLLRGLLKVDTSKRLGALKDGAVGVKEHVWFSDISWLDIFKKSTKPPYIPNTKSSGDDHCFDAYENITIVRNSAELFPDELKDF